MYQSYGTTGHQSPTHYNESEASIRSSMIAECFYGECNKKQRFYVGDGTFPEFESLRRYHLGVVIRTPESSYMVWPETLSESLKSVAATLRTSVVLTISTSPVARLLARLPSQQTVLMVNTLGDTIPVMPSMTTLSLQPPPTQLNFSACVCAKEGVILIWGAGIEVVDNLASQLTAGLHELLDSTSLSSQHGHSVNEYDASHNLQKPQRAATSFHYPSRSQSRQLASRQSEASWPLSDMPEQTQQEQQHEYPTPTYQIHHVRRDHQLDRRDHTMPPQPIQTYAQPPWNDAIYQHTETAKGSRRPSRLAGWRQSIVSALNPAEWLPTHHSTNRGAHPTSMYFERLPTPEEDDIVLKEKLTVITRALEKESEGNRVFDPEKDGAEAPRRPFLLTHAMLVGLAVLLSIVVEMACVSKLITEMLLDGNYIRFALVATIPLFSTFSLFFMIVVTGSLCQIMGPMSGLRTNSRYYSAVAPKRGRYPDLELPHITIQMPVYKEGLKNVIIPTITSVLAAVKHYVKEGGSASIYVNDDGLQLVDEELAEARIAFYELNNIGWCSRPAHCTEEGDKYFIRKGQFKKASNMNYCLDFSVRVEDEFHVLMDNFSHKNGCTRDQITLEDEEMLYEQARSTIIANDGGKTWAGGDVRVGEIILIIDSDTRVPKDCLLYGALEMHESPEVALLQHKSGILQVVNNTFENGIAWFTDLVYTSIQFAVGNGDCAPFVGHNTFIRWRALQSIAFEEDMRTKFWSESHVSEDFDVSLRLQMNNFVVRMAAYHNGEFKEGVSLTVYDELARWEKYAYGCNELVFNHLIRWPTRGPFTRLFMRFLFSNIKITSKITIFAYIGTYYAVASAIPLALANYLLVGWLDSELDQFYLTSWKIFVGMAAVFNVLSPLGYAMLRHRLGQESFFKSLWHALKWMPMFLLFFGGISFHLLKAIICHFFSIKMEWTTTAKELQASGFRVGLDRIVRDFKTMYVFVFVAVAGMIYLGVYAPYGWTIRDFSAIVPIANQVVCHALLPFVLGLF